MQRFFLWTLFFLTVHSFAQTRIFPNSKYAYIYSLTNKQADEIYSKGKPERNLSKYLSRCIDSVPYYEKDHITLPDGHYLFELVKESKVYHFLYSYSSIQLIRVENSDLPVFRLFNQLDGTELKDATIEFKGHSVSYNADFGCYRFSRPIKNEYLKITHRNTTHYLWVSSNDERNHGPRNNRSFRGYVQFSKPLYRPGDTLKFKAMALRRGHIEYRKPMELIVTDNKWSKIIRDTLTPIRPGVYEYELVISEKFSPNDYYQVHLEHKRKSLNAYFRVEDYLLDEVTWHASTSKSEYDPGEDVEFLFSGKDKNGLYIPDGTLDYEIYPYSVRSIFKDSVQIPFAFASGTIDLKFTETTKLVIPDSLFPMADVDYEAKLHFKNSNNEQLNKTIRVQKIRKQHYFQVKQQRGLLTINYFENNRNTTTEGILKQYYNGNLTCTEKISIPASIRPHSLTDKFSISNGDEEYSSNIRFHTDSPMDQHRITADSVFFSVYNPAELPIYYHL